MIISRLLGKLPMLAAAAVAPESGGGSGTGSRKPLDFTDPMDNVYAFAKMFARLDGEIVYSVINGTIFVWQPDQQVKPLMGYLGVCPWTGEMEEGGAVKMRGRELCYYTDLETNKVADQWTNPLNGRVTESFHVRNQTMGNRLTGRMHRVAYGDHHDVEKQLADGSAKASMAKDEDPPFILPWREYSEDELSMTLNIMLHYPNPLDPEHWPLESSGAWINPSEHWTYFVSRTELENRDLPVADMKMVYGRLGPWLPSMLMGETPGLLYYQCTVRKCTHLDQVPAYLRNYVEKNDPDYLTLPPWIEPEDRKNRNWTSWEHFAAEREPTPA